MGEILLPIIFYAIFFFIGFGRGRKQRGLSHGWFALIGGVIVGTLTTIITFIMVAMASQPPGDIKGWLFIFFGYGIISFFPIHYGALVSSSRIKQKYINGEEFLTTDET